MEEKKNKEHVDCISTVDMLIAKLASCTGDEFVNLVNYLALNADDLSTYITWHDREYTRNCIVRTDAYELLLLCWEPGHATPVHCHGGEECWVVVIEGGLVENRYILDENNIPKLNQSVKVGSHDVSYMNDDIGLHSLHNETSQRAITLHLYMNPIDLCKIYNLSTGATRDKKLSYHSSRQLAHTE